MINSIIETSTSSAAANPKALGALSSTVASRHIYSAACAVLIVPREGMPISVATYIKALTT